MVGSNKQAADCTLIVIPKKTGCTLMEPEDFNHTKS